MTKAIKTKKTYLSSVIGLALASSCVGAQEDVSTEPESSAKLERIVVTSQKRVQSLKEVPLSVSVMNAEKIEEAGIGNVEDLATYVPNFTISKDPIGDKINIRGMQSGNQAGFEQSVGTFVNGIYRGRGAQARFAFSDVDRVEVLRGPQSILFGKNTVAGAINITTARPDDEFSAKISAAYTPEFDQREIQGVVTGALTDTLRGRVFVQSREMKEGWLENIFYNTDDPVSDEQIGRLTLEWDAGQTTQITMMAEKSDFDYGSFPHALIQAGPLAGVGAFAAHDSANIGSDSDVLNFGSSQTMAGESTEFSLSSETELDNGTITLIAGHSAYDFERYLDVDYSPLSGLRFDDSEDFSQNSIELRFTSNPSDSFEYIAGIYWQSQEMTVDGLSYFNIPVLQQVLMGGCAAGVNALGGDFASIYAPGDAVATAVNGLTNLPNAPAALLNGCGAAAALSGVPFGVNRYSKLQQDADTLGIFAQGTWHINDDLRATFGLRYTSEEKSAYKDTYATDFVARNTTETTNPVVVSLASSLIEFDSHHFTPSDPGMTRKENSPTWSLNLQYDVNDDTMVYISSSTGFKAGGFNSFYMRSPTKGNVAHSEDVSFEEEEVLSFEVGMKTSIWDGAADLNIAAFNTEFSDMQVAIFSGNTSFEVQNAAKATSQGIEADIRWSATDNLMVTASVGLLDFSYDDFKNQACTSNQFVTQRETNFQQAATVPEKLGVVFGYNNALCAAAHVNDLSGQTPANAPDVTAALGFSHYLELDNFELKSNLDINYHSDAYRQDDLDPISLEKAKALVNGSLILAPMDGAWEVALIAKNLTDKEHFSFANDVPLFAGAHDFMPGAGRSFTFKFTYLFE